jgi:copper chaperone CopZ
MKTTMNKTLARTLAMISVLLTLGGSNAVAGLIEVDQSIWGMDCAPCAYGMEKGLKKLEGVKRVKVSLNKGNAILEFKTDSKLALADIRSTVRDGGFTPKEAKVKVSGTLKLEGDELRLKVGEVIYLLKPSDKAKDAWQQLRKLEAGATVTIAGQTPADHDDRIVVLEVKP